MKSIFGIFVFISAFVLEWFFSSLSVGGVTPPFIAAALFFVFLKLPFGTGALIAVVSGFVIESLMIIPPGTLVFTFFAEAVLAFALKNIFSNTHASFVQAISLGIMVIFYYMIQLSVEIVLGRLPIDLWGNVVLILAGGMIWAVLFSAGFFWLKFISWRLGFSRSVRFL